MKSAYVALLLVAALIATGFVLNRESTQEYEKEVEPEPQVVEVTTVEQDILDAAREELERVNNELNEEEAKLLAERTAIQAARDAEVAAVDARLEEITKIRSSF